MTDHIAATAVAEYALCPRRAHLRGSAPTHLETSAFTSCVRHGLVRAAQSRIAKEAYELSFVVHTMLRERGLEGDTNLFKRVHDVTRHGLRTLFDYAPIIADAPFGTTIAGVRVEGMIDLVAERADGSILVFAFSTGEIPEAMHAVLLALARGGVAETYPGATYVVLHLDQARAVVSEAALADRGELERYVRDAYAHASDEARTGPYCHACDVLARCPEGRQR